MLETIYALASAPGRAGVAVIRVSGPRARESLAVIAPNAPQSPPRQATLRTLRTPETKNIIDHALVLFFESPASFTGEDCVEYHLHGSPAAVRMLLEALSHCPGHRLAAPGEFTRRAFENGKMDLTGAEAIADLIAAETALQHQQALAQMGGALATLYDGWAQDLTRALAHIEAALDFPDEDLPEEAINATRPTLQKLHAKITAHLNDNRRGEILRDGAHIAVIGAPNAGKSSLVNALARRDVAIVSEHAGTTRDVLEVHLDLGGWPVILADTAGLRPEQLSSGAQESIESEGIRRALARAGAATLKLLLFDASEPEPDKHTTALIDERALIVFNKADIGKTPPSLTQPDGTPALHISAQTGEGLPELGAAIAARLQTLLGDHAPETPSLTRQRHRSALEECVGALTRAIAAPIPELMAEDTRLALRALGRITGRVDVEDLLDIIFRDFCIGK